MEKIVHSFEQREVFPMVDPIDAQKIEELKTELEENTSIDFSFLPITISRPGDFEFDLYEAQTKLYNTIGSWPQCMALLRSHGYDFHNVGPGSEKIMRAVAEEHGVVLDDTYSGFAWNIEGKKIVYMAIREDSLIAMAHKYAAKEQDNFVSTEKTEALEYIRNLAEKYFFHEVGHSFHLQMISKDERDDWEDLVFQNSQLCEAVEKVQIDKHPRGAIPVAAEAYADIFSEVASLGKYKNRLGSYPVEEQYVKEMIERYAQNQDKK